MAMASLEEGESGSRIAMAMASLQEGESACNICSATSGGEEQMLQALRQIEVIARCGPFSDGDNCEVFATSAALMKALCGAHGHEVCERALAAVAMLLPALAGIPLPTKADTGRSVINASAGMADGTADCAEYMCSPLWSTSQPKTIEGAKALWQAVGPLIMANLDANRWSVRYHAARCVLTYDTLLSGAPQVPETQGAKNGQNMRIKQLLCVVSSVAIYSRYLSY